MTDSKGKKKPVRRKVPVSEIVGEVGRAVAAHSTQFQASGDQYLARARLWMEIRDGGPQFRVDQLTNAQLAAICRDGRVTRWLEDVKGFRQWLTAHRDTEERLEATYSQFVEGLEFRRVGMSDKDYINCLKLLAEMGSKMPKKWDNTKILDEGVGRMSDVERVQTLVDTLKRLGYSIQEPAATIPIDGDASTKY